MTPGLTAWMPKSVLLLRDYNKQKFLSDLQAGITVGLVALPLAMAFCDRLGRYTSSWNLLRDCHRIFDLGPLRIENPNRRTDFVVVVAGIIAKYGIEGLFTCTMMAGVLLVLLGITGMGTAVKYFPRPVIIGFTNGIAILIASTQIRDFFGLQMDSVPGDFFHRIRAFGLASHTISPSASILSLASLAIMIGCLKYAKKIPGAIVVTFGATIAVTLLHLPVETIGSRFGGIPSGLPTIAIPKLHYNILRQLLSPAFTVAMLGAIESLMSAVVSTG